MMIVPGLFPPLRNLTKPNLNPWGQPRRFLTAAEHARQVTVKNAKRHDRERRRQLRVARSQWRNSTVDFGDGCYEVYDKRGHLTGGGWGGADHDPLHLNGDRTPEAVAGGAS